MSPATPRSDLGPRRTARSAFVPLLAWGLCALFGLLWLGTAVLNIVGAASPDQLLTGLASGYAVVGALVAVREPRNAVGWLMLAISISLAAQSLADAYVADPGLPFVVAVAWLDSWIWFLWLSLAALVLPLLFPDGRLVSRAWRSALWIGAAATAFSIVSDAFRPGLLDVDSPAAMPNPFGLPGAASLLIAVGIAGDVLISVGFALGAVSLVVKLRRSHGRRRRQVTWFAYVGALALGFGLLAMVEVFTELGGRAAPPGWALVVGGIGWAGVLLLFGVGIPVAVGVAILRHRLYDIDLVVKRTLVYGSLTVTLAGVYLLSVLSLRALLEPVAGRSDLAVAASTLAVAALFRPARSRIQQAVDRHFYRAKYDATRTVEDFAGRLRHEVDLASVSDDLEVVVRDTVQPTHVSLWLRGSP